MEARNEGAARASAEVWFEAEGAVGRGLTNLSLSGTLVTSLEPLSGLVSLQSLDVASTSVPIEIGHRTRSKKMEPRCRSGGRWFVAPMEAVGSSFRGGLS